MALKPTPVVPTSTSTNYISRPGPCVTLTYEKTTWVFPLFDDFSLSTTQTIRHPVQELIALVKNAISQFAPNSTYNTAITAIEQYQQLMGTQLLGKGFYASAWAGSSPATLSLKIKAYRGMAGKWNAKDEVFNPLQGLYSKTLPVGIDQMLIAPMPAGVDVLVNYGEKIAGSILDKILDAPAAIVAGVGEVVAVGNAVISGKTPAEKQVIIKDIVAQGESRAALFTIDIPALPRTWTIAFGYWDGSQVLSNYIFFKECIVETSSITYSKEVEIQNDKVYPIKGEVTLSLKSESIITNIDFAQATSRTD